ncbi:MAG: hypothetical protein J1E95_08785 [Muribaculaceae bacterium]|nr:hypothetical protein [Muribaculaceae bacterium]
MIEIKKQVYLFSVIVLGLLISCSDKIDDPQIYYGEDNYIVSLTVALPDRDLADSIDEEDSENDSEIKGEDQEGNEEEQEEEWKEINTEDYTLDDIQEFNISIDDNTTIFISQMTSDIPAFQNEDVTYTYSHIPNSEDATWEEGYNFTPSKTDVPLEWYKIGNGGTYHGGFALYAMHFPLEHEIRQKIAEDGTSITYSVMSDQRNLEDLMRSDVLGAYHSTATLFSRLRFKLHHMMAYLRVRLYVPVYDETTRTGFQEDAIESATLEHVTPDFGVEWSANRSSDSQGPKVIALSGDQTIYMYQHPKPEGQEEHKKGLVKYKEFIGNYYDQGIIGDFDKVRIYDFSVLLPEQKVEIDENGQDISFLSTQFLNFYIRSNSGALNRYYFTQEFIPSTESSADKNTIDKSDEGGAKSDIINNDDASGALQIEPEKIQYLQLYVPRVGNKIVYVEASVNPWKQRTTKLALTEKK